MNALTVFDANGVAVVDDVSFEVRRGEILAIAGVQGNGQTELTETILGLQKPASGSLLLDGTELGGRSVAGVHRGRRRLRPRGPQHRRPDLVVLHRREPHPRHAPQQAVRARRLAEPRARGRERRATRRGVRHPGPLGAGPREHPVRRQPAEGRAGARDVPAAAAARRVAADPRARRGIHRVRAQADRRRARQRHAGHHRVDGARRGARAGRPDRRHVPRQDHRRRRGRAHVRPGRARPDDGRRPARPGPRAGGGPPHRARGGGRGGRGARSRRPGPDQSRPRREPIVAATNDEEEQA